jgi:hypothetical protein
VRRDPGGWATSTCLGSLRIGKPERPALMEVERDGELYEQAGVSEYGLAV